ncbi:MAG TPA: cysteine desulfurase [Actinobacteria bacterium]|nr:cysteine desulfurase [Actinomycetota bacterium]
MRYLDHAATTPLRPEARAAMEPYLGEVFGNPSGIHRVARRAKDAIEAARERAAELLGAARPDEIVFTGGGTEADNLAVIGTALAADRGVVASAIEHAAVVESVGFLEGLGLPAVLVPPDRNGRIDPEAVAAAVARIRPAVVSVMVANNELGTLQPIADVAAAVRRVAPDVVVHTDAVQAFSSEEVTVGATGADLISLSAHKFGGPKGVGLLYVRDGVTVAPVLRGGGQELGRRSGTHNVAGIVGMVAAMEAAVADRAAFRDRVGEARDVFEERLAGVGAVPTVLAPRLPQHAHLRFEGVDAETLLVRLDLAGVAAAAGSACHSGAVEPSHVLRAIGLGDGEARRCVRFTFGWPDDVAGAKEAADIVAGVVEELR